jgi:peptidoglycan L-alanyl-D-glutamate endopeptidase CwlK
MPSFGKTSNERKKECDYNLQIILDEAIKIVDFSILCGHRTEEEQNQALYEGRSKLAFPKSKHNNYPSFAVDIAPYPIDWEDTDRFYYLAGIIKGIAHSKGVKIRWGGDWDSDNDFKDNNFNDLPHFELELEA